MIPQNNKAKFYVDEDKCTGCGRCVNVCSGQVLSLVDGVPEIKDFDRFGWGGLEVSAQSGSVPRRGYQRTGQASQELAAEAGRLAGRTDEPTGGIPPQLPSLPEAECGSHADGPDCEGHGECAHGRQLHGVGNDHHRRHGRVAPHLEVCLRRYGEEYRTRLFQLWHESFYVSDDEAL
jgi:ferredoxin